MFRATTAATLITCLALAGCSSSDSEPATNEALTAATIGSTSAPSRSPLAGLSALQVWEKTKADADASRSVHVAAKFLDGEQRVAINLKMTDAGKVFGIILLNGDRVTVRRLGRVLYFKADRGFWIRNADAATGTTLADKWIMVKQGSSKDLEQFFQLTDMDFIVSDLMSLSAAEQQSLKLIPGISIGRRKTVGLVDETTTESSGVQKLYVSATDPALPLNFVIGTDDTQYMKFRGWNEDFTVIAPKGAIDLATAG